MDNRVIVWFGAGATSAVAAKLAIKKYGPERVRVVYCQTNSEHPSTEKFIDDISAWLNRPIEQIHNGKYHDTWDVYEKTRWLKGRHRKVRRYSLTTRTETAQPDPGKATPEYVGKYLFDHPGGFTLDFYIDVLKYQRAQERLLVQAEQAMEIARLRQAVRDFLIETEYWHKDHLDTETEHPRGSGWLRVYKQGQEALSATAPDPSNVLKLATLCGQLSTEFESYGLTRSVVLDLLNRIGKEYDALDPQDRAFLEGFAG